MAEFTFVIIHISMYNFIQNMEGCVVLKPNKPKKDKKKDEKYCILIIICFLLILGPFLIRGWILLPVLDLGGVEKLNPNINEADMLSYWGTALSCIGTSLLAYVTIRQSDRANEINDRLLSLQEREGKEAYVDLNQDDVVFKEENGYRFVELKFHNITKVPISSIDIEGCDRRIIEFTEKNYHINSKGTAVFISEYCSVSDDMNYNPILSGYRLYLPNYEETFRILSFKVTTKSLYGVSTIQYFNVLMMKSHTIDHRCTL